MLALNVEVVLIKTGGHRFIVANVNCMHKTTIGLWSYMQHSFSVLYISTWKSKLQHSII